MRTCNIQWVDYRIECQCGLVGLMVAPFVSRAHVCGCVCVLVLVQMW